jgi:hypothetical protein
MRFFILTMALFSAFFVSANVSSEYAIQSLKLKHSELVKGNQKTSNKYKCIVTAGNKEIAFALDITQLGCEELGEAALEGYQPTGPSPFTDFESNLTRASCVVSRAFDAFIELKCTQTKRYINPHAEKESDKYGNIPFINITAIARDPIPVESFICDDPYYTTGPVAKDGSNDAVWCYNKNDVGDDYCPEFGSNSLLPKGTNTAQKLCYTDKSGNDCIYESTDSGYKATGQTCHSVDPVPDYAGDPKKPDPNDCETVFDNSLNKYISTCPINPDQTCSNVRVNGEYYSVCPEGCGQIDGVFVCTGIDTDGDGIPDNLDDDPNTPHSDDRTQDEKQTDTMEQQTDILQNISNKSTDANNLLRGINDKLSQIADSPGIKNSGGSSSSPDNSDGEGTEIKIDLNEVNQNTFDTVQGVADLNKALTEEPEQSISEFSPTDQSTSFWTRDYENGVKGVWEEKYPELQQTELFTFLNTLAVSGGGAAPDMSIDFSALGLGQGSFVIDPRVYAFLSIFFLVITGFTCRKIIFGG